MDPTGWTSIWGFLKKYVAKIPCLIKIWQQ
jgi:hypothetical protein